MICEDCSFFVDETCMDGDDYVNSESGLAMCRYNPNAIPRRERELLVVLKRLFTSTNALLIGLHHALGVDPNDDHFPVDMREALEQARDAIAKAEKLGS